MHVLFLSDNFPPETNAPATRIHDHASAWVRAGHRVTVITSAPNFPRGRVFDGYRNRWYAREELDGIEVVRVKTFIAPNRKFLLRTLDYLSFMLSASLAGLFQKRPDVVVASSPQFFAALGGWLVAALRRVPFVFELRDLWPASIRAVGSLRDGPILRLLERLELFLYRRAAAVVSLTEAFRADLVSRGIPAGKICVVTNGVDLRQYTPRPRDPELAYRLGLEDRFVVGYVGTHGMAHALERALEAAALLEHRDAIRLLFVGAGAKRDELVDLARARGLTNVVFGEAIPKQLVPSVWSVCDVALVHLKDDPVFATVIPSKIFEAMGMGLPILFAGPDGEAAGIVRETSSGVTVEAENPRELAAAIVRLHEQRETLRRCAHAAREAAGRYDRRVLADNMLAILERVARGQPARDAAVTGTVSGGEAVVVVADVDVRLEDAGGNAGDDAAGRDVVDDDRVGADHGLLADADGAEDLGTGADHAALADHGDFLDLRATPDDDTGADAHHVADHRAVVDHDAEPAVGQADAAPQARAGSDQAGEEHAVDEADQVGHQRHAQPEERVGEAVYANDHGVHR